jgi:hypothetical protein
MLSNYRNVTNKKNKKNNENDTIKGAGTLIIEYDELIQDYNIILFGDKQKRFQEFGGKFNKNEKHKNTLTNIASVAARETQEESSNTIVMKKRWLIQQPFVICSTYLCFIILIKKGDIDWNLFYQNEKKQKNYELFNFAFFSINLNFKINNTLAKNDVMIDTQNNHQQIRDRTRCLLLKFKQYDIVDNLDFSKVKITKNNKTTSYEFV